VLEKAEQESVVSLIERDHELVSFCSSHILGTALPLLRWVVFGKDCGTSAPVSPRISSWGARPARRWRACRRPRSLLAATQWIADSSAVVEPILSGQSPHSLPIESTIITGHAWRRARPPPVEGREVVECRQTEVEPESGSASRTSSASLEWEPLEGQTSAWRIRTLAAATPSIGSLGHPSGLPALRVHLSAAAPLCKG
jgi:hypothetical protein